MSQVASHYLPPAPITMSDVPAPLHRIGVIADVQYVDDEDAFNYSKTRRRYYRQSLEQMRAAIERWREEDVHRVLQLGDLLDGKSGRQGKRDRDFAALRQLISGLPVPWHHCIGNHELYNFGEAELRQWMSVDAGIDLGETNYYAFSPTPGFVILVLNSYEISDVRQIAFGAQDTVGEDDVVDDDAVDNDDAPALPAPMAEARGLLETHNANTDKNSPTGLDGLNRRWCAFNGALGADQLEWLDRKLAESRANGDKVLIASHVPVDPRACADVLDLTWDYDSIVRTIAKYSDIVVAVFAGHDHDGKQFFDEKANILYVTFKAVLETGPESNAFAVCELYEDKLELKGFGEISSFVVTF